MSTEAELTLLTHLTPMSGGGAGDPQRPELTLLTHVTSMSGEARIDTFDPFDPYVRWGQEIYRGRIDPFDPYVRGQKISRGPN